MLRRRKQRVFVICLVAAFGLATAAGLCYHHVKTRTTQELQPFYVNYSLDEIHKMQQDADRGLRPELLDPEQTARAFLAKGTSDQPPVTIAAMVCVPDEPSSISTDMFVYVATLHDGRRIKLMVGETFSKSLHRIWVVAWYEFLS